MKKLVVGLLALSLALNFVLGMLAVIGSDSAGAPAAKVASASAAQKPALPALDGNIWPNMQGENLPALVRNLREAGFPPELVRAIATAQLDEQFLGRLQALYPGYDQLPFWKNFSADPSVLSAAAKLSNERARALREALGPAAISDDPSMLAMRGRRVDSLPPDKAAVVLAIFTDYDDQRTEIYSSGSGLTNRDRIAALEKAQREAIARVLTPQELEEFDLRNHPTARQLRNDLTVFAPTEEEFRTLFRLKQPFDDLYGPNFTINATPTRDQMLQRADAQRVLTDQIKAALGPERYADYERSIDFGYRQTSQLVARLELPPATTNQIWAVQKDLQQRARDVLTDRTLPADARTQQLATLNSEATSKLTPLLGGTSGFDAYKQYGGSWLNQLQPRPAPPPRP